MEDTIFNPDRDRAQRAMNDSKKQQLHDRYGMEFPHINDDLPPEIEGDFLEYVAEFERQWETAERVTVRSYIDNPSVKPLEEIPEAELGAQLDALLEMLGSRGVGIDCICDVEPRELYRFITEELLEHEMDGIRIPGMMWNFIYEEFHPNHEYDAKQEAEHFFFHLFSREIEWMMGCVGAEGLLDAKGNAITREEFTETFRRFISSVSAFTDHSVEITGCALDSERARVEAMVHWSGLQAETMKVISGGSKAIVQLVSNEFGDWDIVQVIAEWPGGE